MNANWRHDVSSPMLRCHRRALLAHLSLPLSHTTNRHTTHLASSQGLDPDLLSTEVQNINVFEGHAVSVSRRRRSEHGRRAKLHSGTHLRLKK